VVAAAVLAAGGITTTIALASGDGGGPAAVLNPVAERTTPLEEARGYCAPGDTDLALGDEGRSMTITGAGHYSGADIEDVACVLDQLDIPDSVVARIDSTRALDGMQEASWDDFTAVWTYHPDDGLNLIIEDVS
jgi:hypothetical protein